MTLSSYADVLLESLVVETPPVTVVEDATVTATILVCKYFVSGSQVSMRTRRQVLHAL